MQDLLAGLNEPQSQAVAAKPSNLLVLAGAGSGKTRVLVHRIAWLITEYNYSPYSILAVTFTNKAAGEIKGRIEQLLAIPVGGMWVGTFHSIAHRLLRSHYDEAGLAQNFQILDAEDQKRLIKRAMQSLSLDENSWSPREAQWFINKQKDQGLRPNNIPHTADFYTSTMVSIYRAYEDLCSQSNVIDFAEILLRAYELFKNNPTIQQHYQARFKAILVDEFQDTNKVQYQWLRLLACPDNHTMIVGDDDQSIYGWRGARIENIKKLNIEFSKEADEKGQLYGAISKKEILNFLKDNEVKIHSDYIVLSEKIRSIGEHEIIVNPYTDIQETIIITVLKN